MSTQEEQAENGAVAAAEKTQQSNNDAAVADVDALLGELDQDLKKEKQKSEQNGTTEDGDKAGKDKLEQQPHRSRDDDEDRPRRRDNDRDNRGRGGRGRGRGGRGGGGFKRDSENIKSNLIVEEKSDDPVAIRKQVEFYFSDSNLPNDKFLLQKVQGSKNEPVEIEIIRSFKRMRHFEPLEAIVAALKESKVVQLTEDDTKIQRVTPLPEQYDEWLEGKVKDLTSIKIFEDKAMPRSVYVKGFGHEVPSTQFDIEAFFSPYGPTNAIRLRRTDDKIFKGSVFAEFENEELAKAFIELDPKPKYKERELKIMTKKEYCDMKKDDIEAGRIRPSADRPHFKSGRGRGRGNDRRGDRNGRDRRDDRDDRDWRTRRDEDRKNGFRDRKSNGRDDRDRRDGRDSTKEAEKDDNGIPVVRSSSDAKADALAQAKAAVEADSKKDESKKRERDEDEAEAPVAKKVDVKADA